MLQEIPKYRNNIVRTCLIVSRIFEIVLCVVCFLVKRLTDRNNPISQQSSLIICGTQDRD